jgi:putative flippase GtrA
VLRHFLSLTALKFAATGMANTLVGVATLLVARDVLGMSDYVANAIGYAVGLVVSFLLNRSFTFADRNSMAVTAPRFLLAFAASYAMNLLVLAAGLDLLGLHPNLAQAAAIVTYSVTFFLLCRSFVFRAARLHGS